MKVLATAEQVRRAINAGAKIVDLRPTSEAPNTLPRATRLVYDKARGELPPTHDLATSLDTPILLH